MSFVKDAGSKLTGKGATSEQAQEEAFDRAMHPAYIREGMAEIVDGPLCVLNLAEDGYGSAGELLDWLDAHGGP